MCGATDCSTCYGPGYDREDDEPEDEEDDEPEDEEDDEPEDEEEA